MHSMKFLIFTMGILAVITVSGIYSFVDAHMFSWIPSSWIVHAQMVTTILIGLSIIGYASRYIYYACKRTDKPSCS